MTQKTLEIIEEFNISFPIGTRVWIKDDLGEETPEIVTSDAWDVDGVVMALFGSHSQRYAINRVRHRSETVLTMEIAGESIEVSFVE